MTDTHRDVAESEPTTELRERLANAINRYGKAMASRDRFAAYMTQWEIRDTLNALLSRQDGERAADALLQAAETWERLGLPQWTVKGHDNGRYRDYTFTEALRAAAERVGAPPAPEAPTGPEILEAAADHCESVGVHPATARILWAEAARLRMEQSPAPEAPEGEADG